MSIFGSDYPPGCHGTPADEEVPCEVCGGWDIDPKKAKPDCPACICQECPECGGVGNPTCYKPVAEGGHGLVKTQKQTDQLAKQMAEWEKQSDDEAAYYCSDKYKQEQKELEAFYAELAKENP